MDEANSKPHHCVDGPLDLGRYRRGGRRAGRNGNGSLYVSHQQRNALAFLKEPQTTVRPISSPVWSGDGWDALCDGMSSSLASIVLRASSADVCRRKPGPPPWSPHSAPPMTPSSLASPKTPPSERPAPASIPLCPGG